VIIKYDSFMFPPCFPVVFCPVCLCPVAFRRTIFSVPVAFPVAPWLSWQGSVSAVPLPSQYPRISDPCLYPSGLPCTVVGLSRGRVSSLWSCDSKHYTSRGGSLKSTINSSGVMPLFMDSSITPFTQSSGVSPEKP